jgi:hypothetical protein
MMRPGPNPGSPFDAIDAEASRRLAAYEETLPELESLDKAGIRHVNLPIPLCVTTALSCLGELQRLRARIEALEEVDTQLVNGLERYTLALAHAHGKWMGTTRAKELPKETIQEARKRRDLLRRHLALLTEHGVLPLPAPHRTRQRSHASVALELTALCSLLRTHWLRIEGNTPLTLDQIAQAEALGDAILTALGKKKSNTANTEHQRAEDLRARAFTLFHAAYDEARRAITYLLWHQGNTEDVVPSLYRVRNRTKRG